MRCMILMCATCLVAVPLQARAQTHTFDTPSDDRWHYPFNGAPGARPLASCFGTVGVTEFEFNDRDGVLLIAWDTTTLIPAGQGPDNYAVRAVRVVVTNQAGPDSIPIWEADPSVDEWFTYDLNGDSRINGDGVGRGQVGDLDGESDDVDPGRPIELFGVSFGDFFDSDSWAENSPFIGGDSMTVKARDPFAFVYRVNDDDTVDRLHVEDSIKGLHNDGLAPPVGSFTAEPWAIGIPQDYTPGTQTIPFDVEFDIEICAADGHLRKYFQEQLNDGRIIVAITSLNEAFQMQESNGFPNFFTKEGAALPGAKAPQLIIELGAPEIDCNANGIPDACDLAVADCNENGAPDDCDILSGHSDDLDDNGIPDECVCTHFADCADLDGNGIRDDKCVWWACQAGACVDTHIVFADMGGQFGVCPPDGTADGNDRFQALNCFANAAPDGSPFACEPDAPAAFNVDAGGQFGSCSPDGVCDGNDAFAALNAFGGSTSCSCPLDGGPSPDITPATVSAASLTLASTARAVRRGERLEVEVYLATALDDLRGYQLHLGVSGGSAGTLDLIDIAIGRAQWSGPSGRRGAQYAFPWSAFNLDTAQMIAGRDEAGIPIASSHLATFTYRVSDNARGVFAIELMQDPKDGDHRTFLFPTEAHGRIELHPAKPLIVNVTGR